jgi:hypothetical protein
MQHRTERGDLEAMLAMPHVHLKSRIATTQR